MFTKLLAVAVMMYGTVAYTQTTAPDQDTLPVSTLQEVVVSANREAVKRSEAPIAIVKLSSKTINETKASSIDQLLNKVSGVNMVNLGNEQHQMSIRQPITTKSYFLYLEDGIPIRTTGLFNHNALLEINMAAVKNIEVIKGPSSSMYGSEAIGGVVNFITQAASTVPSFKLSSQMNNLGYRRQDLQTSIRSGRWGITAAGYYADKNNTYLDYSDFHKGAFSGRIDVDLSSKTTLTNKITWIDYYSDMPGGIDSIMFAKKEFINQQTFTYRKVKALRFSSSLVREWSDRAKSTMTLVYRDNEIGQNPAYRIKDDYKKKNHEWKGNKTLAHGEINKNSFNSYAFIAQHRQKFDWKRLSVSGGISADVSPSAYTASYIRIKKDTLNGRYVAYEKTDSVLSNYETTIGNYAGFVNIEFSPVEKLRIVAALRYDHFSYRFNNHLHGASFSGSGDTVNYFSRISSKMGATYNFSRGVGIYANYSEGFIPPQVTEMYTGVQVPHLEPSVARNYEVGGWAEVFPGKLSTDVSVYRLISTNEVVSMRMDDGSFANVNAGKTSHKGIEVGVTAYPVKTVTFRLSGAYSRHRFEEYVEKGESFNGKEMNGAPHWIYNTEVWWKPASVKGFRVGAELQHVGAYFTDPKNTSKYDGYTTLNIRLGYEYRQFEFWINALNIADSYYATNVSKSAYGTSYTLADPISINAGFVYNLGLLFR